MFRDRLLIVSLRLLIMSPQTLQAADMCRRVHDGKLHMQVLTGHAVSNQTTLSFEECADLCENNPSCYSVNYYEKQRKCEQNDKTSFHHPENMIRRADGSYLDIHRPYSACSDYFCDVRQVCKMDGVDRTYCRVCDAPLGMESGQIKDSQVTASSVERTSYIEPFFARLHNKLGHWVPQLGLDEKHWLKIDFADFVAVTKVATQGRSPARHTGQKYWVKSYKLSFSKDGASWKFFRENGLKKVFAGNEDMVTVVTHALSPKVRNIRYVKFVPKARRARIALRVEVYGCKESAWK